MKLDQRIYHQSGLIAWQRCPRRIWLQLVKRVPTESKVMLASTLGTAAHAGVERVFAGPANSMDLWSAMIDAFEDRVQRDLEAGLEHDPDAIEGAIARLEHEYLPLVDRCAQDPRLSRVMPVATEHKFSIPDGRGRTYGGTIDFVGRASSYVAGFAVHMGEPVDLDSGDVVVIDWKFAREIDAGFNSLALNMQLAIYCMALPSKKPPRAFLARMRDYDRPRAPVDSEGNRIPKNIESVSEDYLREIGDFEGWEGTVEDWAKDPHKVDVADKSRKRFKGVKKRRKRVNPEFEAACDRNKGPVFYEAVIDWRTVKASIVGTVREIERAFADGSEESFPARGHITGGCMFCPVRKSCVFIEEQNIDN